MTIRFLEKKLIEIEQEFLKADKDLRYTNLIGTNLRQVVNRKDLKVKKEFLEELIAEVRAEE